MRARASSWVIGALMAMTLAWPAGAAAQTVCLDPGHGGSDPGAVGCGLEEADVNLDTGLRLRTLLQDAGYQVIMTRDTDTAVALASRSAYANSAGADRFVSIHSNSAGSVASGIETYCATAASSNSFDLRDKIQEEMVATWPLPNRGGKTANYSVLVNTAMPATLTELGFINNCAVDATYLADPGERQAAAAAHLRAIQRHYGQNPVSTGWARGAVFEDQGAGTDDMSIRLPGAEVTVVQTGDHAAAEEPDGLWGFQLEAGSYTIRASQQGYQTAERGCEVTANATAWCSIGLFPEPADPEPDGGEEDGLDGGLDGGFDGGDEAVADGSDEDGSGQDGSDQDEVDAGSDGGDAAPADGDRTDAGDEDEGPASSGGGCDCGPGRGAAAGPWAVFLFGALILLGRRRTSLALLALLMGAAGLASGDDGTQPVAVRQVAPTLRLAAARALGDFDCQAPVLSPEGRRILCSDSSRSRVRSLSLDGREEVLLAARAGAGVGAAWTADGQGVLLRPAGRPFAEAVRELVDLSGRLRGPVRPADGLAVLQSRDRIFLLRGDGRTRISPGGDRFFAPLLSPDGRFVVYNGLASGLYLFRLKDGRTFHLGPGNHPTFAARAELLVFDRSADDGHHLTAGDLWLVDLRGPAPVMAPLTDTPEVIETWPSLSADGRQLACLVDGTLQLADLEPIR